MAKLLRLLRFNGTPQAPTGEHGSHDRSSGPYGSLPQSGNNSTIFVSESEASAVAGYNVRS